MAYQNVGTPRFYINHFSKEINPTTINTYSAEAFTYSFDLKPNYVMLLGTSSGLQITADIHNTLVEKVNYYIEGLGGGFSLAGYALMDYTTASTSGTLTITGDLAELVVGRYYDMPHSPDLSLSMSHEYEGIKTITTKGGSTLSNTSYYKPAKWGDREVMTNDLLKLGLHKKLLEALSNRRISQLFSLIGWAAPVFEKAKITEEAEA